MTFNVNGSEKEFQSFHELVNGTSRKERNAMFGSSLVYSEEYDTGTTLIKVGELVKATKHYLEGLETVVKLLEAEQAEAERKKELLKKLYSKPISELEELLK